MPGSFTKENRPVRPGAYFNWEAMPTEVILPNIGSVVCLAITHDWGPANRVVACNSLSEFMHLFGPSVTTPGYAAVKQCFKGEAVQGRGGAGQVLVYRMVGAGAAVGTLALQNTGAADAITLTAKYTGGYAAQLGARVRVSSGNPLQTEVLLTLRGVTIESHRFNSDDIAAGVDLINRRSQWVNAEATDDTTALDTSAPFTVQPFTGYDDGADLTVADWMDMLDAVSTARYSLFAAFDLTDIAVLAALQNWVTTLNYGGKRFMAVVGGPPDDTAETAIDRSTLMSGLPGEGGGENIVNLGVGTLIDSELGELSTSQLAPRIAGVLAARGETMSLTYARMQGCVAGVLPSDADITACFDGGVTVFGQDSNAAAPCRVEKGLTSYTGGVDAKPYLIYRNPKFVRTMHGIELEISEWAMAQAIGSLQVNDQTRALIVGYGHKVLDVRVGLGVIQTGYTIGIDQIPPPSDMDEFVAVVYGIAFGRSLEQIFNTVYIV